MTRYEWDPAKAAENRRKHGVRFEDAVDAFDDPFALVAFDDDHSETEGREIMIGRAMRNVLVVIFTERVEGRLRIISARRADRAERKRYEDSKIFSI